MVSKTVLAACLLVVAAVFASSSDHEVCSDDGVCDRDGSEGESCQDCNLNTFDDERLGYGLVYLVGGAPPKQFPLTIIIGIILVVLLVIASYAAHASGKPTPYWKKKHASRKRK